MPRFARLRAAQVEAVRPGLARLVLADGSAAYALTDLCGPVAVGDELLVNTAALDMGLGSGGGHVVHTNLSSPFAGSEDAGRVMKARYLAEQMGVDACEEPAGHGCGGIGAGRAGGHSAEGGAVSTGQGGGGGADAGGAQVDCGAVGGGRLPSLAGSRVLLCVLHSHAMAVAAAVHHATGEAPGYVMTDGGALPFVFSDLAAACLERGVIAEAVSVGQAFGAPVEAVTVSSGVAALGERGIDRVVVAPGPGHLGTASPLGFSALDLAGHAWLLSGLGAATALAVRASSQEQRDRHLGISHHTRTMAALSPPQTAVPVPNRPPESTAAQRPVATHATGAAANGAASSAAEPGAQVSSAPESSAESSATEWTASLGERVVALAPLGIASALARNGLSITTMGRPLTSDEQTCDWLGAAAAWLAAQ